MALAGTLLLLAASCAMYCKALVIFQKQKVQNKPKFLI